MNPLSLAPRRHRPLRYLAYAMACIALVSAAGYGVDHRVLVGAPIWAKPLKFAVSFGVYAVTLDWLISRLQRPRVARWARRAGTVIAGAAAGEMLAIVVQVVRGRESHFDVATPFDAAVFAVMGVLVGAIFLATIAVGVALLREAPMLDRATTLAVRLGLAISVAGMSVGFLMLRTEPGQGTAAGSGTQGGHSVGVPDGGPALPLLGWDTTGGDLRIPHFVGLHALQALPLLAFALTRLPATARLTERLRVRLVLLGAAGWAGLFALTLWQALRGQPITAPDRWTVAAAAVLVTGVVAGVAHALRVGYLRRPLLPVTA